MAENNTPRVITDTFGNVVDKLASNLTPLKEKVVSLVTDPSNFVESLKEGGIESIINAGLNQLVSSGTIEQDKLDLFKNSILPSCKELIDQNLTLEQFGDSLSQAIEEA